MKSLLAADLFCGAGGFDEALRQALLELGYKSTRKGGVDLLSVNHWDVAIASHALNHPDATRMLEDVFKLDPLRAVPGGELDLLMASPTCTYFSRARGGRPVSWDQRRGRMTPQQVIRWCETLTVRSLVLENVPEFRDWGPICRKKKACAEHRWAEKDPKAEPAEFCGKAIAQKKGKHFRWFLRQLTRLGYRFEWSILNAANYGDATTRERFFLIAILNAQFAAIRSVARTGNRKALRAAVARYTDPDAIPWPDESHSDGGASRDLFSKPTRPWRAAREILDKTLRGRSIFRRKKALADNTLLRIYAGLIRFQWPERFVLKLRLYMESLGIKIPEKLERAEGHSSRLVMRADQGGGNGCNVRGEHEPVYTPTTNGGLAVVEPGVVVLRRNADMRSAGQPLPTVCAGGTHLGVVEPLMIPQGSNSPAKGVSSPVPTVVAIPRTALVEPFVFGNRTNNVPKAVEEPLGGPTTTTGGGFALVEPAPAEDPAFLFPLNQGKKRARGLKGVGEPLPTVTASGTDLGLVTPFMLSQGAGGAPRSVEDPVPTIPTEGAHALVAPFNRTGTCKSVDSPLDTITTRDRFGLVMPVTHADASNRARSVESPLPTVTTAARGELAFISAAFGERKGQAPRVHSIEEPVPTVCAAGSVRLVQGVTLEDLDDVDILFRMLEPHELAAAMSFPEHYRLEGNKGEQTRQIGNAVPVATARALLIPVLRFLLGSGKPKAAPRRRRKAVA